MNDPAVLANPQRLIPVNKEVGQLQQVVDRYLEYRKARDEVAHLEELVANKADAEMSQLAETELPDVRSKAGKLLETLKDDFLAAEDNAVDSFFLEIRAGTGGEE